MSIDSVKRQIEGYKRDIDREKSRIADSRDDMAKIRIRKSRDAVLLQKVLDSVDDDF